MGSVLTVMNSPWGKMCLSKEMRKNLVPNAEWKGITMRLESIHIFFSSVVFSFEASDEELFLFILLSSNLQNLYHFPKMHWHVSHAYPALPGSLFTALKSLQVNLFVKRQAPTWDSRSKSHYLLLCWKWISECYNIKEMIFFSIKLWDQRTLGVNSSSPHEDCL